MLSPSLLVQLTAFCGLLAHAQSPLQLGFLPLAVKTPYLHGWVQSGGQSPAGQWPNIVSNNRILGWAGMIRVDSQPYQWMGNSGFNLTRTVTSELTPSKSIFRIEAGPIQFNVTFFSPIEPNDYVRHSMPFSYMYIDGIAANDSQPHTVQVYSDISAEWVSKEDTAQVIWNTTETNDMMYHHVTKRSPSPMVENEGISEDSTAYFATVKRPGLSWREGNDVNSRRIFATNGTLTNTFDNNYRPVSPDWPVFPFSVDLGTINPGAQPDPVIWAIGLVRDPLVTDTTGVSVQNRTAYYWSNYTHIDEVISAFLGDFPDALNRNLVLDTKILSAGSEVSPEYGGILSLVTRQIFASMDITIPSAQSGQFNTSDIKIFMKDIGQSRRTNPVEVLYGALPALLLFNTSLARDSLQPLLESQSSPQYPNAYAAPDLGASYPLVRENTTDTHTLAVENCGNMLIMVYAHAAKSGDGTLLSRYYSVLQRWADFLIQNSIHPRGFITADGLNNPDMSNLALKGILGVYSMAKINEAVGVSNTTYMDQATQFIKDWKQFAIGEDGHIQAVYGQTTSWGLLYNLFPAVWLNTGLIEDGVLETQAQFYAQQSSPDFGLSLDSSRPDTAYPHWTLMTAATIPDGFNTTRNDLIKSIYQRVYMPQSTSPLPVAYKPSDGSALFGTGSGSPILGAAFAVAAMRLQNVNITTAPLAPVVSPSSLNSSHATNNVGAIVGGVLGALAFLLLMTAIFTLWRKHKRRQQKANPFAVASRNDANIIVIQVPHHTNAAPGRPRKLLQPPGVTAAPLPVQGVFGMSQKQREAGGLSRQHLSTHSESPLLASSHSDSESVFGAEVLREELELLRREVESIRHVTEAPPIYT